MTRQKESILMVCFCRIPAWSKIIAMTVCPAPTNTKSKDTSTKWNRVITSNIPLTVGFLSPESPHWLTSTTFHSPHCLGPWLLHCNLPQEVPFLDSTLLTALPNLWVSLPTTWRSGVPWSVSWWFWITIMQTHKRDAPGKEVRTLAQRGKGKWDGISKAWFWHIFQKSSKLKGKINPIVS